VIYDLKNSYTKGTKKARRTTKKRRRDTEGKEGFWILDVGWVAGKIIFE